ncbi:hypothetical protein C2855_21190 [Aeromonas bestiarum]|uniref:hypothetical protein n=1 Tax=Aeromonas bestiarum TaxID=105751 RepID=UPI000CD4324A|nr:hypothetical protein [Aeromonas bestiarum]POG21235.1 hypothetical protein C2855_21190 [Aeromonas bestiarum]
MPPILSTRYLPSRCTPLLALTFVGCTMLNPGVAQLERYQQARADGQWEAIADDAPVDDCQPVTEGCAKLYTIYGEANLLLAFASRAADAFCPPPVANGRLNSAAASFSKSEKFTDLSLTAEAKVKIKALHAQALYCLAENASSIEQGMVLVHQSAAQAAGLPRPDALFWQAMSHLYLARPGVGTDAQRCAAAHLAGESANAARAAGVNDELSQTLDRVLHDAEQVRRSIAGCME